MLFFGINKNFIYVKYNSFNFIYFYIIYLLKKKLVFIGKFVYNIKLV